MGFPFGNPTRTGAEGVRRRVLAYGDSAMCVENTLPDFFSPMREDFVE